MPPLNPWIVFGSEFGHNTYRSHTCPLVEYHLLPHAIMIDVHTKMVFPFGHHIIHHSVTHHTRLLSSTIHPISFRCHIGDFGRCHSSFSKHICQRLNFNATFFFRVKKEFEDSGGVAVGPTPLATIPDEEGCPVGDGGKGSGSGGLAGLSGQEAATAEASFGGPYREASKMPTCVTSPFWAQF